MTNELTFTVTLIKPSEGIPQIERGAYLYSAELLPRVGETIPITRGDVADDGAPRSLLGYVTRVDPFAEHPISVVEADGMLTTDDLIVESDEPQDS
jgi:hypothetical protein